MGNKRLRGLLVIYIIRHLWRKARKNEPAFKPFAGNNLKKRSPDCKMLFRSLLDRRPSLRGAKCNWRRAARDRLPLSRDRLTSHTYIFFSHFDSPNANALKYVYWKSYSKTEYTVMPLPGATCLKKKIRFLFWQRAQQIMCDFKKHRNWALPVWWSWSFTWNRMV